MEYFQQPPAPSCPGDRLYQLIGAQQANGRIAQLVFYNFHFDFKPEIQNWTLSPAGINNVYKIARLWPSTPGTVVVESSGDPSADQIRLQVVKQSLAGSGVQADVAIGRTPSVGLTGIEAINIYQQRLQNSPLSTGSAQGSSTSIQSGSSGGN